MDSSLHGKAKWIRIGHYWKTKQNKTKQLSLKINYSQIYSDVCKILTFWLHQLFSAGKPNRELQFGMASKDNNLELTKHFELVKARKISKLFSRRAYFHQRLLFYNQFNIIFLPIWLIFSFVLSLAISSIWVAVTNWFFVSLIVFPY